MEKCIYKALKYAALRNTFAISEQVHYNCEKSRWIQDCRQPFLCCKYCNHG